MARLLFLWYGDSFEYVLRRNNLETFIPVNEPVHFGELARWLRSKESAVMCENVGLIPGCIF